MLLSGSSGFIGSNLAFFLERSGHEVFRLVRNSERSHEAASVYYNIGSGAFRKSDFEGMDAVIHLAGYGIVRRWTSSAKKAIVRSRVGSTELLCRIFSVLDNPPKVFLCASATGFYGDRGDERLSEESRSGEGFLARLAQRWENAAQAASLSGARVVNLRFGVVLAKNGGALGMMRLPFRLGLGATAGDGSGYLSWVSLRDAVRAVEFILDNKAVSGPVNIVSPAPVRSGDFVRILAKTVNRPAFLSLNKSVVKLVFGQMGEEVVLSSARVFPQKLIKAGFVFEHSGLENFLRLELGERICEKN